MFSFNQITLSMYNHLLKVVLVLSLGFVFYSCTEEKKESENEKVEEYLEQILDQTDSLEQTSSPVVPELLGSWVVAKMTLDQTTNLSEDVIGKMTYTFEKDGKFIFDPNDENVEYPAEPLSYTYNQNVIKTSHFPLGEARITKLNADTLVFVIEAAGQVEYVLARQQ